MRPEIDPIYLAALVNSSDDAIIAKDLDGIVVSWNRAAERIFGYSAAEIIGQSVTILFPPERLGVERGIIDKIKRSERIENFETVRCAKDGRAIPVSVTVSPILDTDGVIMGISTIARDIGHIKQTNAQLRQYADAFEKTAFGIAIVDGKTNAIGFANPALAKMLGMSAAELQQMRMGDVYAPEERAYLAGLAATIDRTGHLAFDSQHIRSDGSTYPVHMDVTSVRDAGGAVLYRIASAFDITDRKRAELELQETRRQSDELLALLDTLQSSAPIGIAFIDRTFRYVRVNDTIAVTNGFRAQDLIGHTVQEVIPDLWQKVEPILRAVSEEGKSFMNIEVHRAVPGSTEERHWISSYYPVRIRSEIIGIGAIVVEITDQKRLEKRLIQVQKMEAIGNLTGGMAHDFNNLLSVIIGNLGLLRENATIEADLEPVLADAVDAAERGADLISHLLAFARRQPLQPQRVDPNTLVTGIVKLLRRTLGEAIEIVLELEPDVWPVVVDPAQLEATLTNLATNARDAMPNGGRLIIATMNRTLDTDYAAQYPEVVPGDYAVIKVSDTGIGMTASVMSRIFEPFFTTKGEGKGTGLGLSMVFGFIKQSGGHINVYSEVGHGTSIRLYLPREAGHRTVAAKRERGQSAHGNGETVLVVEDNAGMRRVVIRQLTELGYRVVEAESAAVALATLETQAVDLLFTDIVMPGNIDGLELARRVTARWPQVKIVLTSGFPETKINGNGGSISERRLLSKPYRKDDLARVLREVLDS